MAITRFMCDNMGDLRPPMLWGERHQANHYKISLTSTKERNLFGMHHERTKTAYQRNVTIKIAV